MLASIFLFLLGASAGVFLVVRHFLRRGLPGWLAVAHGVFGAVGFGLLIYFCIREPRFVPARCSLGILAVAVGLGCVNVIYHLRRVRHRTAFIVAHALAAVAGVTTLTYGQVVHARSEVAPIAATAPTPLAEAAPALAGKPPAPAPERGSTANHRLGLAWSDQEIQFATNSATPTSTSLDRIAAIAEALEADPEIRLVEVQGHSDERGDEKWNLALTRERARAVLDALVARGVASSRLRSAGYGSQCAFDPICRRPGAAEACHRESTWRRDRRVDFVVVDSGGTHLDGSVACWSVRSRGRAGQDTSREAASPALEK